MINDEVHVGQIWADADPRSAGRRVRVLRTDGSFAYVKPVDARGLPHPKGRETRIRIFPGRGLNRYRLDKNA